MRLNKNEGFPGALSAILDQEIADRENQIKELKCELDQLARTKRSISKAKQPILSVITLEMLGLSSLTLRRLKEAKVENLQGIITMSEKEWAMIRSFGERQYWELKDKLKSYGFVPPSLR